MDRDLQQKVALFTLYIVYLLPANEVWGKVMFSQTSVCPWEGYLMSLPVSVQRGRVSIQGDLCPDTPRTVKSGRYTFYWNAFFFLQYLKTKISKQNKMLDDEEPSDSEDDARDEEDSSGDNSDSSEDDDNDKSQHDEDTKEIETTNIALHVVKMRGLPNNVNEVS